MLFKRIDHIELLTAAPERAVAFYTGVLGFRERERMRIPQTPQGPLDLVYLQLGDTTLEVMCYPEAKAPIAPRSAEAAARLAVPRAGSRGHGRARSARSRQKVSSRRGVR